MSFGCTVDRSSVTCATLAGLRWRGFGAFVGSASECRKPFRSTYVIRLLDGRYVLGSLLLLCVLSSDSFHGCRCLSQCIFGAVMYKIANIG